MVSQKIHKVLPSPDSVKLKLPCSDTLKLRIDRDREEIGNILRGKDKRKILIIGPCSAWPSEAVLEYAEKLSKIFQQFSDHLKIILRVYTQKPRTTLGWTGPLTQPDPFAPPDIETGIYYCREMMLRAVEMGLALGDEALFTHNDEYFEDLLSWIAIGARSAEDQEHRVFASMIPHPVGLKNPTSGDIEIGVNSVMAVQHSHIFSLHDQQVETSGNLLAHLVLRGGNGKPNCALSDLRQAIQLMKEKKVLNPAIIVDGSHENSINIDTGIKDSMRQEKTILDLTDCMLNDKNIFESVKGFMVESFLVDGKQDLLKFKNANDLVYGQSVTDACLGWEKTEALLKKIVSRLSQRF